MSSCASLGHGLAKGVVGESRLGNVRYPVIVLACNGAILFSVSSITISYIKASRMQQTTAATYHVIVETAYAEIIRSIATRCATEKDLYECDEKSHPFIIIHFAIFCYI